MPDAAAARLRAAVASRSRRIRGAWLAFGLAVLCMPLGPVAGFVGGVGAWLGTLVAFALLIMLAAALRTTGRRRFAQELARVTRIHEAGLDLPHVRVSVSPESIAHDALEEPEPADQASPLDGLRGRLER
jgi:hypothetical protein